MNRKSSSDYGTLAERGVAGQSQSTHEAPPAPRRTLQHCWVTDAHGQPQPGLLIGWEQRAAGWYGRVVHAVGDDIIEEWLPAGRLAPAAVDE